MISGDRLVDKENVIGKNIRKYRLAQNIGQKELVNLLQVKDIDITRETLVKIEGGRQHVKLEQLRGIKEILDVTYEDLLN